MPLDASLWHSLVEIFGTYAHAFRSAWIPGLVWLTVFVLLASRRSGSSWPSLPRWVRLVAVALMIAIAVTWAWRLVSLFDDAYISLRYARNLVRGQGLVFNPGERVEGYTNFLWTLILAAGLGAGFDGAHFAILACLILFVLELPLVARVSRRLTPESGGSFIPLASILLGGSYTFATYGTSGMETMLSAVLTTLMIERALAGSIGLAGLAGILAVMNHPDGALLYLGLGVALALDADSRRSLWRYGLPFTLLYVPYFVWRWQYYGDLLPNTYYAKSGDLSYWRQGIVYLWASGLACGLWALLPLALHAVWRRPRHLLTRFAIFGVIPYVVYVAKIGGDFMLARLLVPVLPVFAVLAERGYRDILTEGKQLPRWISVGLLACAVVPTHLIGWRSVKWYLSDERTFFAVTQFWPEVTHLRMERVLAYRDIEAHGARPLVGDFMVGLAGYDSDLPMVDELGLTDRTVAHQPLARRGRPGHEKIASVAYLRSRGVRLSYEPLFPDPYADMTVAHVRRQPFYLATWDPEMVGVLRSVPGATVPDMPGMIDAYIARPARVPEIARKDLEFFDEFYFAVNRDSERRARLTAALQGSGSRK